MRREMLGLLKCVTCPHFSRTHLHLPSRRPTFQEVQNQPGQIEASDLASILTPKSSLQKKQKNTLFRSDATGLIFLPQFTQFNISSISCR
jgi:hypothetical protein